MKPEAEIRKHLADLKYASAKFEAACPPQEMPWKLRHLWGLINQWTWILAWACEEHAPEHDSLVEEVAAMVREL